MWPRRIPRCRCRRCGASRVTSRVQVRAGVAQAVSAPAAVLEALASDRAVWVRRNVASNPSTPPAALEALLGDRRAVVRAAAAHNENTPVETVAARVRDRALKVRAAVATRVRSGPSCSLCLLRIPSGW